MKKLLILVAVLVLMMSLFVACGGDDTTAPTTTKAPTTTVAPPTTTAKPPVTTAKPPVTTAKPPVTTVAPPTTTVAPPTTTVAPPTTTVAPPTTTVAPPTTTVAPPTTTVAPPTTTVAPPTTTKKPEPVVTPIDFSGVVSNLDFENHHADLNNNYTLAFYFSNSETDLIFEELVHYSGSDTTGTINEDYAWTITIHDGTETKVYPIDRFSFYIFDATNGFIRCDLGADFALTPGNITYAIKINIVDGDGNTAFVADLSLQKALLKPSNIELPAEGLATVEVDQSSLTLEGLTPWGDGENVTKLFDGDNKNTKLGGNSTGTVTVGFTLNTATTLTYYTIYTGNDSGDYVGRNPNGWVLYGKVGEDWVALSTIENGDEYGTGLEDKNATPYSYAVSNPQECTEYKIVFTTGGTVQLNELVLYAAASEIPEPPTTSGNEPEIVLPDVSERTELIKHDDLSIAQDGSFRFTLAASNSGPFFEVDGVQGLSQTKLGQLFINGKEYQIVEGSYQGNLWYEIKFKVADFTYEYNTEYVFFFTVDPTSDNTAYYADADGYYVSGSYTTPYDPDRPSLNVTIPDNVHSLTVNPDSITAEGINTWGDGESALKMFDGDLTDTKMGGGTTGDVTISFSLSEAAKVTYYTLYTGKDSAQWTGRNPNAWTLYGKVGEEWVVLSEIVSDANYQTGMQDLNSTPYSYQVSNVQECIDYKIVFKANSALQLNEIVLTDSISTFDIQDVDTRYYAFEFPSEFDHKVALIYYFEDKTTKLHEALAASIAEGLATVVVYVDGVPYTVTEFANGAPWFRFNIESSGATILAGVTYTIGVKVYDTDGNLLYYAKEGALTSGISTADAAEIERTPVNIELPAEGLTEVTVIADSISGEGANFWGDGAPANLFDGDTAGTKLGGNPTGTVTVNFALENAATLTYYTLYTGGDTADNPDRNPVAWTLYGKVGDEWVVLAQVTTTNTTVTGLGATNATPYAYAVTNAQACTEYKVEFTGGGALQLNEMKLYIDSATAPETPDTTTPPADTEAPTPVVPDPVDFTGAISNLAFENHHADLDNNYTVVFYFANSDTTKIFEALVNYDGSGPDGGTINEAYAWTITINDGTETKVYPINRFSFYVFDATNGFIRCDLGAEFALTFGNITYEIKIDVVEKATGNTAFVANLSLQKALLKPSNIELPAEGITTVEVDQNSLTLEGLTPWGDGENVTKLFDGDNQNTKLGGNSTGTVTVGFALDSAATLTYYTIYTGNDSGAYTGRNPSAWVLYGKVGEDWVALSTVENGEEYGTGLEDKDATPYSYAVSNPQECTEYKIVFTTPGSFQLNELVLYTAA